MKAIQVYTYGHANEAFRIIEKENPAIKANEVLIKVDKFGINFADVLARKGMYNDAPPLPFTPGYEVVGSVESVGQEVENIKVGDYVLAFTRFGGYATHCIANPLACVKIEKNDTDKMLALATQYCTAYYAFYFCYVPRKGENVLIHAAAGGVGLALCEFAKLENCNITATVGNTEKAEFLKQKGIKNIINYQTEDFETAYLKLHSGKRPDAIFDSIGGKTFKKGLNLLAYGGSIVTFGAADRKKGFFNLLKLAFDFGFMHPASLLMKSKKVCGLNMLRIADNKPEALADCMKNCVDLFNQGKLNPHIGEVFNVNEIAQAHQFIENRNSIGKIVVEW